MNLEHAMSLQPALEVVRRAVRGRRDPLVLVDGPSGSGKSTFAAILVDEWPARRARLVRVDEAIPGWHGLRAGSARLGVGVVGAHRRGAVGVLGRWDWMAGRPGPTTRIPPGRPLVVEGCGAFLAGAGDAEAVRVWLDAPVATRRDRALERDAGAFDDHWDGWESDWRRYRGQSRADRRPTVRVRLVG